jgi:hypothetical protein
VKCRPGKTKTSNHAKYGPGRKFETTTPSTVTTVALDIEGAGLDQAYWNDGSGNFEKMLAKLQSLDQKKTKQLNKLRDIVIARRRSRMGQLWLAAIPICDK